MGEVFGDIENKMERPMAKTIEKVTEQPEVKMLDDGDVAMNNASP